MKAMASFVSPSGNVMTKLPDHLPVRSSAASSTGARSRTKPTMPTSFFIVISFVTYMKLDSHWHTNRRPGWFQFATARGAEDDHTLPSKALVRILLMEHQVSLSLYNQRPKQTHKRL